MQYAVKSLLIDRLKDEDSYSEDYPYSLRIKLFNSNDPHLSSEVPVESLEFERVTDIVLTNFSDGKFLPMGNHMVFNNLKKVKIDKKIDKIYIRRLL